MSYLGTLGNNAPFIGLLGTVIGIVGAFEEFGKASGDRSARRRCQSRRRPVMTNISEALVATAVGLLVAIPAVFAFNTFQRLVRTTLANTDALAHILLAHLKAVGTRRSRHRRDRRGGGVATGALVEGAPGGPALGPPRRGRGALMAGGSQNDPDEAITGINVTPLVDITLVLLIIFMVTAKIIVSQSLPLDLPKASQGTDIQVVFSVSMGADGTAQVDGKPIANDDVDPHARPDGAAEEPRSARRHQGRQRGATRAGHSRARFAEAGAREQDRVRSHAHPADGPGGQRDGGRGSTHTCAFPVSRWKHPPD